MDKVDGIFGDAFLKRDLLYLKVCNIFSKAIYLVDKEKNIYVIYDMDLQKIDFGIGVKNFKQVFDEHHIYISQVAIFDGELKIGNITISPIKYELIKKEENIPLIDIITQYGKGDFYDYFINHKDNNYLSSFYSSFYQSLIDKNEKQLDLSINKLIGYGKGLTPDFDDYLVGLLYAFNKIDNQRFELLKNATINNINITTTISQRYLLNATKASQFDIVTNVNKDKVNKEDALLLLSFGQSSGTNIAFGIYHARKLSEEYGI
ncbi:MAG: DUF2877 domain-containing protein [Bacilli bacterium]